MEGKYPKVDQYLSLIKKSDTALQELIEYYSQVDRAYDHLRLRRSPAVGGVGVL